MLLILFHLPPLGILTPSWNTLSLPLGILTPSWNTIPLPLGILPPSLPLGILPPSLWKTSFNRIPCQFRTKQTKICTLDLVLNSVVSYALGLCAVDPTAQRA